MDKETFVNWLYDAHVRSESVIKDMVDGYPCGGAWVEMPADSLIVKLFKKYGEKGDRDITLAGFRIGKNYGKPGYALHDRNPHLRQGYQNMDIDIAKYNSIIKTLAFDAQLGRMSLYSYID